MFKSNKYSQDTIVEKYKQLSNDVQSILNITYLLNQINKEKKARNAIDEVVARAFAPSDDFKVHFHNERSYGKTILMVKTN